MKEAKKKYYKYGDARQEWMKLLRKFEATTGASKTRLRKKFDNCKIYDVNRNPEEWITDIKLLRGDLQKHDVKSDHSVMMTHIPSNLPEENQSTMEILGDELYDYNDQLLLRVSVKSFW